MLFKCTIFNGQQAIIPNYIGNDFVPNDKINFVNLGVGANENYKGITELTVRCNSVHNDGTDTYITFNDIFTKYTHGFIEITAIHDQIIGVAHTSYNQEYKNLIEGQGISLNFNDGSVAIGSNTLIDGDLPTKPLNLTGFTIDSSGDTVDISKTGGGGSALPSGTAGQVLIIDDTDAAFSSILEVYTATSPNATGINSFVQINSIASGDTSSALSYGSASGDQSHADSNGISSAYSSHANSNGNASGESSYADSYGISSNYSSHADSGGNASGGSSHADSTGLAFTDSSHADSTGITYGNLSHANSTGTAYGIASHANSSGTAFGDTSHAESGANSLGPSSHSEGNLSNSYGTNCHSEGFSTSSGPQGYACVLSSFFGIRLLATINDVDLTTIFPKDSTIILYNLSGGSGSSLPIVNGTVHFISFSDPNTLIQIDSSQPTNDNTEGFVLNPDITIAAHSEGNTTVANGHASHAGGINSLAELPSKFARSDGQFSVQGDNQLSIIKVSGITTSATPVNLLIGQATFLTIRQNIAYSFIANITARKTDGSALAMFLRQGIIHNLAGTVALVGSINTIGTDINIPSYSIAITADDTNKCIQVQVTGEATVNWGCRFDFVEIG